MAVDYLKAGDSLKTDGAKTRGTTRRKAAEDLAWSLMNTVEFLFNH